MKIIITLLFLSLSVSFAEKVSDLDNLLLEEDSNDHEYYFFVKALATYNNYADMENTLRSFIQNSEVDLDFTDNFPVVPTLALNINFSGTSEYYWGGAISYHSTGARLSYADYSGSTHSDFITSTTAIGVFASKIYDINDFFFMISAEAGVLLKEYDTYDFISVAGAQQSEEFNFDENSMYLMPNISFGYTFNNILLGLNIGGLLDRNSSAEQDPDGQSFRVPNLVNFGGLRLGLIASYNFQF